MVTTVVGAPDKYGVVLGPLPAGINLPEGKAAGPNRELYIADNDAILVADL
jgi:hypothetical protein